MAIDIGMNGKNLLSEELFISESASAETFQIVKRRASAWSTQSSGRGVSFATVSRGTPSSRVRRDWGLGAVVWEWVLRKK